MQEITLQNDELQALLDAANALKIPAASLKPVNPFRSDLKSPTAQTIQLWLRENRPEMAARLSGNSGHEFSLAAVAAERGLRQHDAESHREMLENSEIYAKQKKSEAADFEARMLKEMDDKVREAKLARGEDPDEVQVVNPHLMGSKFRNYAENLNLEARRERNAQG